MITMHRSMGRLGFPQTRFTCRALVYSLALFLGLLAPCQTALFAGTSNSLMDISADGRLLACSNRDAGTVTILELPRLVKRHEVSVGKKPEGVSFIGSSSLLAVAVYQDDCVTMLDAEKGEVVGQVDVFDEPYGVVSDPSGTRIYVTLDYPGQILEIDPVGQRILRTFDGGAMYRGLALDVDRQRVYASEYLTGIVRSYDLEQGKPVDQWQGAASDNLARQLVLHPTRPKAYLPHIRSRISTPEGTGSIFPLLSIVDTEPGEGKRRKTIPLDSFIGVYVPANPWESAVSPDGQRIYTVFAGTDDMIVGNLLDDNYQEVRSSRRQIVKLGHNPRAVRVSSDNQTFYVYNALDFEVVAYDAQTLQPKARATVCENPLGDEILLGKRLFYSALQPMVGQRWISCASCHPDGDGDGRTWQNPEGLRNTTALFGMAWTHPIHWSADRDESQDFEHTIRSPLMQGRGLIRGRVNDSLGEPNKGKSPELDALAAYCNSHEFPLSPHAKTGLSEGAKRGRTLFMSDAVGCANCHSGPYLCDSTPVRPFKLHDVGTGNDDPSELMGPKYDTPTLLGLYRTAPYLHHGKATTLTDVLTTYNRDDRHGKTSHLTTEEIADLVEFLKALPYEDSVSAARAAGMMEVKR
jgi:6-phosphogluconolactonase (cycloisomerase 2 family)